MKNTTLLYASFLMGCMYLLTACRSTPPASLEDRLSSSGREMHSILREVVVEPDKLQTLITLTAKAEQLLKQGASELGHLYQEQQHLLLEYTSSESDFSELGDRIRQKRSALVIDLWDIRQQIAELTTDEEWKEITSRGEALFTLWGISI